MYSAQLHADVQAAQQRDGVAHWHGVADQDAEVHGDGDEDEKET